MTTPSEFPSLGLRPELVRACLGRGYRTPMPIQNLAIPEVLSGRDLIVQAKTGSGKTLAYGLPLLQADPRQSRGPEVLIVTPTRELARQVAAELTWAGAPLGRTVVLLDGGNRLEPQRAKLALGANIVVGTTGRLLELHALKSLALDNVRHVVLDEADELMQRGFGGELAALMAELPKQRQTIFCSATMPVEVETLAKAFARHPKRVGVTAGRDLPAEVRHEVVYTNLDDRDRDLAAWLLLERPYQCLLFTASREEAEAVTQVLGTGGFNAEFFHGALSPVKRRRLLGAFRSGDLPILVATDIAARGLDLPGVTHVMNYSLPRALGAYVHRSGRTGRAGRAGVCTSLVIPQEIPRLEHLRAAFAFEAVAVRGAEAGARRPLRTEKLTRSRQERRGKAAAPGDKGLGKAPWAKNSPTRESASGAKRKPTPAGPAGGKPKRKPEGPKRS